MRDTHFNEITHKGDEGGKWCRFQFGNRERLKNMVSQLIASVMRSSKEQELQPNNEAKIVAVSLLENRLYQRQNAVLAYYAQNAL